MASTVRQIRAKLREFALSLPETHEDLPWGERVVKVKKKVFVFLGRDMDTHFGLGVKLPSSNKSALTLPFVEPTGYGLGKSGWVSARFEASAKPSFEQLREWVQESYCAVAPKSLATQQSAPVTPASKTVRPAQKAARKAKPTAASTKRAKRAPKR